MKKFPVSVCLQTAFEWERQWREGTSFAEQRWEKEAPVCVTQAEMKAKQARNTF